MEFDAVDAALHDLVRTMEENLEFNKKVSTIGDWYSHMPWGAPKQLKQNIALVGEIIDAVVKGSRMRAKLASTNP